MADNGNAGEASVSQKRSASPGGLAAAPEASASGESAAVKRVKLDNEGGNEQGGSSDQPSSPTTANERGRGRGRGGARGAKRGRGARKDNFNRKNDNGKQVWGAREKVDKQRGDSGWQNNAAGDDDDATGLNRDGTPKLKELATMVRKCV